MQLPDWLISWWHAFRVDKDELCILLVCEADRLVGVAPWYVSGSQSPTARLRFLGDGIACSDHSTVLVLDDYSDRVTQTISEWLKNSSGSTWQSILLESIDENDAVVEQIVNRLAHDGYQSHTRATTGCWTVDLPNDWEEFLSNLSRNHRKRCRRWQRTYLDTGRVEVELATVGSLPDAWTTMAELNLERRRHLGDRSAFAEDRFHQFHLDVLAKLMKKRQAEIRLLRIDGELVAEEYILTENDTVFCYQSGMRTSVNRDGYGNISILTMFRDAIDRGFKRLDFLRGDEQYKSHWAARCNPCLDYHIASRSLAGAAQINYVRAMDWMRSVRNSWTAASCAH